MKIKEINKEDREFILFAHSLINKARYPSFEKVTETYNRVFGTSLKSTSCGTCVRQRILDLKKELDKVLNYEKENASSQNISTSNEKNENNELNGKEVNQSQEVKESDSLEGMEQPKKENTITKTKRSKKVKNI